MSAFGGPVRAVAIAARSTGIRPAAASGGQFRAGSLKQFITRVMPSGRAMAVKDVTTGIKKAGYKTKNKTLAKSVGVALAEMPNVQRIGRGQFKLIG